MLSCKLGGRQKKAAILGVAETAGGGGRVLSLLGLNRGFRRTSGCLVGVAGGLNWAVKACGGSWQAGLILDRIGGNCLWWMVQAVVGVKVSCWVVWEDGVQTSSWEEFGKVWRSMELGILGKVELGYG